MKNFRPDYYLSKEHFSFLTSIEVSSNNINIDTII